MMNTHARLTKGRKQNKQILAKPSLVVKTAGYMPSGARSTRDWKQNSAKPTLVLKTAGCMPSDELLNRL